MAIRLALALSAGAAVLAALPAPSTAADKPQHLIDTLRIPASARVDNPKRSDVALVKGRRYRLVVSGSTSAHVGNLTQFYDALYCFDQTGKPAFEQTAGPCSDSNPQVAYQLYTKVGKKDTSTIADLAGHTGSKRDAYEDTHVYDVTFTAPAGGKLTMYNATIVEDVAGAWKAKLYSATKTQTPETDTCDAGDGPADCPWKASFTVKQDGLWYRNGTDDKLLRTVTSLSGSIRFADEPKPGKETYGPVTVSGTMAVEIYQPDSSTLTYTMVLGRHAAVRGSYLEAAGGRRTIRIPVSIVSNDDPDPGSSACRAGGSLRLTLVDVSQTMDSLGVRGCRAGGDYLNGRRSKVQVTVSKPRRA